MRADYETLFASIALALKFVSAEQVEECLGEMDGPGAPRQIGAVLRSKGYISEEQFRDISRRISDVKEAEAGISDEIFAYLCLKRKLALGYHLAQYREARRQGRFAGNLREFLVGEGVISREQASDLEGSWKGMVLECPGCGAKYRAPEGTEADLCCPECQCVFRLPSNRRPESPAPLHRLGDYEIEAEIGKGSMGLVFKARHIDSGRTVALKTVPASGGDGSLLERFRREAAMASSLTHPSIVPVVEVGEAEGVCFIAMEYVEGRTLEDMLAHGRLPLDSALRIILEAARAVHFANRAGVMHRDIKPGNIMVDGSGGVKICDFGLAKQRDIATITASGTIVGTPMYMSPEQATPGAAVDFRTDIYSLGATLYETVTGVPPFVGKDVNSLIRKVKDEDPPSPLRLNPSLPEGIAHVIMKAMEKSPGNRYSCAGEMADDLLGFISGRGVRALPPGRAVRAGRFLRRHAEPLFVLAAALTMGAVAVGLLMRAGWGGESPAQAAGGAAGMSHLAFSALRMRSYEEAARLYTAVLDAGPDGEASLFRGTALRELGRTEEALADFRSAKAANPANPRAWLEEGIALAGAGLVDAARDSLLVSAMLGPADDRAWMELARVSFSLGRFGDAERAYSRAAGISPGNRAALRGIVEAAAADCDREGVDWALREAGKASGRDGWLEFLKGIAALSLGTPGEAGAFLVKAEESGCDEPDLRRLSLSARLGLGLPHAVPVEILESVSASIASGAVSESLAAADKALSASEKGGTLEAELRLLKGRLLLLAGRREEAAAVLVAAAESGRFRCDMLFAAGRALAAAGLEAACESLSSSWKSGLCGRPGEARSIVLKMCESSAGKGNE